MSSKKEKESLNLLKNFNTLLKQKSFILSALNLSFLSYFYQKKILNKKFLILWPDGLFAKFLLKKKIPGWYLISKINISKSIKKIIVLGNLNIKEKKFLQKRFKILVEHKPLPNDKINILINKIPKKLTEKNLYIITLPTPKQEFLAFSMFNRNKKLKIICIGGGLAIASGSVKKCPKIMYKLNLEFLWRLRTDTFRRIIRLLVTFFNYFIFKYTSNIILKFNKI